MPSMEMTGSAEYRTLVGYVASGWLPPTGRCSSCRTTVCYVTFSVCPAAQSRSRCMS
jgi:hypothetical protein